MKLILLSILFVRSLFSYTDPELENLWSSLSDITNPTLEDYRLIESYFQNGDRPYLKRMYDTSAFYSWELSTLSRRVDQMRNFKLVGPNGEMPIFELYKMRVTEQTKDRCILLYSSYNPPYPKKLHHILEELNESGYSGNVLIRIGGFPNLSEGGLKFCPYFSLWKNEFFKEALRMGFTKILHIDTSIHPLRDLNPVFESISSKGYYLLGGGYYVPYLYNHQYLDYLNFPFEQKSQIQWIPCYTIGFNFENEKATRLFYDWDRAIKDIEHFFYFGWDEVIMSILSWKHHLPAVAYFHSHIFENNVLPQERWRLPNTIQFQLDSWRN